MNLLMVKPEDLFHLGVGKHIKCHDSLLLPQRMIWLPSLPQLTRRSLINVPGHEARCPPLALLLLLF